MLYNNLKFALKHLKRSYMFRSHAHPQGAHIVPCKSCSLKTLSESHRYRKLVLWQRCHSTNLPTETDLANPSRLRTQKDTVSEKLYSLVSSRRETRHQNQAILNFTCYKIVRTL
jgi:hypothetical protein